MKQATRQLDMRGVVLAALAVVLAFAAMVRCDPLWAQGSAQDVAADPPGRAARLAVAEGQVSLQPAGVEDWVAADVNRPLTLDDRLWVDAGSRAEIDAGTALIRLGAATGFSFLNLDDQAVQMRLAAGTAIIRLRQLFEGQSYEVDTPNLAVSLMRPGTYRIEVNGAGDTTTVKVVQGDALVVNATQSFPVARGQEAIFSGTDQLDERFVSLGQSDALELWSMQRDAAYDNSDSRQYVADDIPGAQDLDSSGQWDYTNDYGYVWTPNDVGPEWVPYSAGTWTWVAPWGWTWVDSARWGYAPFHYGRWTYWAERWRWVPGPRSTGPRRGRACYAPALVAWSGGAPGVAAWFPLGPREPYTPGFRVSPGYLARVNAGATYAPGRVPRYVNATIPGAVTAVPHNTFVGGRPIRAPERLGPDRFTPGAVSAQAPALAPVRQSVLGAGRPVFHPGSAVFNRPVVARMSAPAPAAPFERQRAAVLANGNRPLEPAQLQQLAGGHPASVPPPVRPAQPVQPVPPLHNGSPGGFAGRPEPPRPNPPAATQSGPRPMPQPAAPRASAEPRPEPRPYSPPAAPRVMPAPALPHPAAPPPAPHAAPAPAPRAPPPPPPPPPPRAEGNHH